MRKYIKFIMSKGGDISVDEDQARRILKSPQQSHPVMDENGNWTSETINKAFMVTTQPDHERTRAEAERERMTIAKLEAPEMTEEQMAANRARLDKMRQELIDKKVISKARKPLDKVLQ